MSTKKNVQCRVHYFRSASRPQDIKFNTGIDLNVSLSGEIGPHGITSTVADLIDFAVVIYQIEYQLRRFPMTNPPKNYELTMQLRDPKVWNPKVIEVLQEILRFLGNAEWSIRFQPGLRIDKQLGKPSENQQVNQVVLFSGGLDSTCGLATIIEEDRPSTRLVFFSTGKKGLQKSIASELGFKDPIIFSRKWNAKRGRNRTFYYRSFLFLCLAAAVATSWGKRRILHFENGVLASAIPPSQAWIMTKHAHPRLHQLASDFFSLLLGGEWCIENPFLLSTKRECFNKTIKSVGKAEALKIAQKTTTCWYYSSNRVVGGSKKPGTHCGVCIPCIVRRTALQDDDYQWDLRQDSIRNDPKLGRSFRSYFGFLEEITKTKKASSEFYRLLPAPGRNLVALKESSYLKDLHRLFLNFSDEFMETFQP
jgi:7-cyano-7-deazaguanine synthase in queuosine biosynthesis